MELNYNRVELCGTVLETPVLSHVNHGCAFYRFPLSVLRLSGQPDKLQIIAPQSLLASLPVSPGDTVAVTGQLRSFNNKSIDLWQLFKKLVKICPPVCSEIT